MKILYLPSNIASMQGITAEALDKLPGVEARCLSIGIHNYQTPSSTTIEIRTYSKRNPLKFIKQELLKYYYIIKLIAWADVIHFVWDSVLPGNLDLKVIRWLKKPGVVEWVGSDIRCPSKAFPINKYLKAVFNKGYEYNYESDTRSLAIQSRFKKIGFEPALAPEMHIYLEKKLFPTRHLLMQRINISEFQPKYPDSEKRRPLIIHSPSAKIAKGSNIIIPLLKQLQKEYEFDFVQINNKPRGEVLQILQDGDIFLDQLIFGGYGMAAMEAMSYGKPVMCYIMPEVFEHGLPEECPIVNTNPENLKEQLIKLITNPQLRYEIGIKSRAYAEKYHDADQIAVKLLDIYEGVINRRKCRSVRNFSITT